MLSNPNWFLLTIRDATDSTVQIWADLMQSDLIWSHLIVSDLIWHLMSSNIIWSHLISSHLIWSDVISFDLIWCHLISSHQIWSNGHILKISCQYLYFCLIYKNCYKWVTIVIIGHDYVRLDQVRVGLLSDLKWPLWSHPESFMSLSSFLAYL